MIDENSPAAVSVTGTNYIPALLRYKWYIAITIAPLVIIVAIVVTSIPPMYTSAGTVMVETQKIPEDLVQTTVTTAAKEQIDIIKQRVMTRDRMLEVIRKYDYFNLDESSPIRVDQVINSVRRSIQIDVRESRAGREMTVIAFQVGFESRVPRIAYDMANELVTLFLIENIKVRTERASETTSFLRQEAAKVKAELDETEAAVAKYKQEHKDSLPEHATLYSSMRVQATEKLNNINRDIRGLKTQIELLRAQLALSNGGDDGSGIVRNPQLEELKARYKELSMYYKPNYPDLVALREQIKALEANTKDEGDPLDIESTGSLTVQSKIGELNREIAALVVDKNETEKAIVDLEQRILNIPLVERGLIDLNRDYEAKLVQYNSLTSKIMDASMAESLEKGMQAEKFSLLEPPRIPRVPTAPNRLKLMAMGTFLSFGFPIGLALLIGHLDRTIRSPKILQAAVKSIPVISVHYAALESEITNQRKRIRSSFIIFICSFFIGVVAFHFLVMPIDQVFERLLERFGIFIF